MIKIKKYMSYIASMEPDIIYIGDTDSFNGKVEVFINENNQTLALYDDIEIQNFLIKFSNQFILDITNIDLAIWAPIIRACILGSITINVEYDAPISYWDVFPLNFEQQEIKSKISTKIEPIQGFTPNFSSETPQIFVPILGFQGTRALYLYNSVEPKASDTFPIVSLPGIKISHYQDALISNRAFLMKDGLYRRIKHIYAFGYTDTVKYLQSLSKKFPDHIIRIGLLGPRVQCLAAIVCATREPNKFELIYDHPEIYNPEIKTRRKKILVDFRVINEA